MLAQLSPYRLCAALLLKEEGQSHSTMSWTHFARWTPVLWKPAVVTTVWCASVGFSAAAAARAAVANLSNKRVALERRLQEDAMTVSELFAVACGLSLLFSFASFWQGDDSGGWA